jgi:LysM repeat protein
MINKKLIFPFLIPYACSAYAYGGEYIVKKADTLTGIVQTYREHKNLKRSKFEDDFKKVLALNPLIKNRNLLSVGYKVLLPSDYTFKSNAKGSYEVKFGDTFSEIAQHFGMNGNIWAKINQLKKYNPQVRNIDFIKSGDFINIPASEAARGAAAQDNFIDNDQLLDEISSLKSEEAQYYILIFRSLVSSESRLELMRSLKNTLELSRKLRNDRIEQEILELIVITLKSKDDLYLEKIKNFLILWKDGRKNRNQSRGVLSV